MKSRYILVTLALAILLLALGCSTPMTKEPGRRSSLDLADINSRIKKPEAKSSHLDVGDAVAAPDKSEKVKDLSVSEDATNPYLSELSAPPAVQNPDADKGEGVLLNFDNADIYEVIQVIGATLGFNYIVDPQVKGVVNIRSGQKIPMSQLPVIFKKILNINGLDIRTEGEYQYIHPSDKLSSRNIFGPGQAPALQNSPRPVIQIIPIMNLSSAEAMKMIQPYVSDRGFIENLSSTNTLIITDFESNVVDALTLLSRLDVSALSSLKVRLVRIENAPLFDMRDELLEIFKALQINKNDHEGVSVITLERVNSLLLVSGNKTLLENAEKWAKELDVIPDQGRDNIYIYHVRNSVASDLSSLVNSLISENGTTPQRTATPSPTAQSSTSGETANPGPSSLPTPSRTRSSSSDKPSSSLHFAGNPILIPDDGRNVILLRAMPADYTRLMKLLERLDNLPRQVLIEVMVAEVQLNEGWKLGIEWALKDTGINVNHHNYTQTFQTNFKDVTDAALGGFTYSVVNSTDRFITLLNALADDNNVTILSSPQVMVLNNETATVNVGQEVPIVTSESINDTSGGTDTRTVQYRNTGIILTVTPRINYNGIILLDIDQQVSEALTENKTSGIDSPIITNRQLKTKLAVKDGQSILMGGLIDNKVEGGESGVPLFKDIPVMGWLFKYETYSHKRTELLIMITPYVIESEDVLDQYIREFQKKTGDLRDQLIQKENREATGDDTK